MSDVWWMQTLGSQSGQSYTLMPGRRICHKSNASAVEQVLANLPASGLRLSLYARMSLHDRELNSGLLEH